MTQRFCRVLGLEPGLADLQTWRLTALLVRDCAPALHPSTIIGPSVVIIVAVYVDDSAIPGHSVPVTATSHVGELKRTQGSALLLVTAREQIKVGESPQLLQFRLRVRVTVGHHCLHLYLVACLLIVILICLLVRVRGTKKFKTIRVSESCFAPAEQLSDTLQHHSEAHARETSVSNPEIAASNVPGISDFCGPTGHQLKCFAA